jgi:hypothetical protein
LSKENGIFTEEGPKKEKIKKKKENKPTEDFVPRRSARARHSTGSIDDDGKKLNALERFDDEWEEKPREVCTKSVM